jgi:signal transduction histidine kinase
LVAFALLISHRLGRILLPLAGMVVACWSLGVTALNAGLVEFGGGAFGFAETAGMLLLLIMVVRRSHQWLVVFGGGALVLAVGAQPLRNGMSDSDIIIGLLFALVAGSVAATGAYLRSLDGSRQRQVQLVRAEQRAELARDLHDFVAHHVTGIVVQAQGARIIAAQDPERVAAALEQIEKAGAEAMASMRRMVGMLRDTDGDPDAPVAPLAGIADLPALLEGFNSADEITAHLHVEGALDDLPVEITSSAYRIVMEALTNVRRHAHRASRVDVVLHRTPEWLLVRVTDDGHGGHTRGAPGFGLIGLNERVHALGGRIQAGPDPAGGWVIDAALPLAKSAVRAVRG